jgi:hypothetical protein
VEHFECEDDGACLLGCAPIGKACDFFIAFGVNAMGGMKSERIQAHIVAHELGHTSVSAHLIPFLVSLFAFDLICKISPRFPPIFTLGS